ncbi:MAG: hypothetical protein ACRDQW_03435, partial [Haloechinothrix sp.]
MLAALVLAAADPAHGHDGGEPPEPITPAAAPVQRNAEPPLEPTPQDSCGPGSRPETELQGRVRPEDHRAGRAAKGFTCNTRMVGKYTKPSTPLNAIPGLEDPQGTVGGFKVERYVDAA